jgi:putative endonuclease
VKEQLRRLLKVQTLDQARQDKMILGCYVLAADMEETWRLWASWSVLAPLSTTLRSPFPQVSVTPPDLRGRPHASSRRWPMAATGSKKQLGVRGEDLACAELERQGMQVLERNWRCRLGEIDIVAAEAGPTGLTLVFCEVKCRSGLGFGHPLEAITYTKMRTLRQLAAVWMRQHRMRASSIRLDAIGVVLQPGLEPSLTYVRAVG